MGSFLFREGKREVDFLECVAVWNEKKEEWETYQENNISETDTRCKIIDPILKEMLGWEEQLIVREPKVEAGYIDYICNSKKNYFVLEAKKTSVDFRFPKGKRLLNSNEITDTFKELKNAIDQARRYAKEKDCQYCIISNGLNLVFTKTYPSEEGNDTYILVGKDTIEKNLSKVYEIMSPYHNGYTVLNDILNSTGNLRLEPQYKETLIDKQYNKTSVGELNRFAGQMRPYLDKYFGDLADNVTDDVLNELYCDTLKLEGYSQEMKKYLRGRVPFYGFPVKTIETEGQTAGEFSQEYKLTFQNSSGQVFILVGNIGAGKTTFLNRFYKHIIDEHTRKHLVWININFEKYYPTEGIDPIDFVFEQIENDLRTNYKRFQLETWEILNEIYEEEINIKKQGVWKPFLQKEDILNEKISGLIENALSNQSNHFKKIIQYLKRKGNEVCLVFDNLDHHSYEIQEKISYYAVSQAKNLNCIMMLSLRDETFWEMRSSKPMDAFGNIKVYQIIPPDVNKMLLKRLSLVKSLISDEEINFDIVDKSYKVKLKDIFLVLENTIKEPETKELFEKISSGNMRNALEIFRTFATSGHTKLPRTLVSKSQKIHSHEVLKSIGLSNYINYSSDTSKILNLFRIYQDGFYSHFITLRILELLIGKENISNVDIGTGYVSVQELSKDLSSYCKDENSLRKCLIPLLQCYLIDSDIGSRKFGEQNYHDKIKYVKVTPAGKFYYEDLLCRFEYLEMILHDTQIKRKDYFDRMFSIVYALRKNECSPKEYWEKRFELVETFIDYLKEEEERDMAYLQSQDDTKSWGKIIPTLQSGYLKNKEILKQKLNI